MDRPKPISLKKDLKMLKQELKEIGEDHLLEVMESTRDQASYIRAKDRRFNSLKSRKNKGNKTKLPPLDVAPIADSVVSSSVRLASRGTSRRSFNSKPNSRAQLNRWTTPLGLVNV
mmetsp:Transcript_749/g.1057  ORF Transcript_749/g.1057 Transcript_749/m.1057 type:complete len:116 (+) Transcript_749:370-717(+)